MHVEWATLAIVSHSSARDTGLDEKEPTSEGKLTTKICRTNAYIHNPVCNLRNKDSAQRCIGDRETGRWRVPRHLGQFLQYKPASPVASHQGHWVRDLYIGIDFHSAVGGIRRLVDLEP